MASPAAAPVRVADWSRVARLRVPVSVQIPLQGFCVRGLLSLRSSSVLRSVTRSTDQLPLCAREQMLAKVEFEVNGMELAVRITELA